MNLHRYRLTIFALSASGMLFEIIAFRQWRLYLRTDALYIALPLVMAGLAAGAISFHITSKKHITIRSDETTSAGRDLVAFLLVSYAVLSPLPFLLLPAGVHSNMLPSYFLPGCSIFLLFVLSGIWGYVNADFFDRCRSAIFSLYLANLLGTIAGGTTAVFFMDAYGMPRTISLGIATAIATVWLWDATAPSGGKFQLRKTTAAAALFGIILAFTLSAEYLTIFRDAGKNPLWFGSNSFSQLEMQQIRPTDALRGPGALASLPKESARDIQAWRVYFDRLNFNYTNIIRYASLDEVEFLKHDLSSLAFLAGDKKRALILGAGGGIEVIQGILAGYKRIDAVEINPLVIDALQHVDATGFMKERGIYYHIGDARRFPFQGKPKFDLIFMPHVRGQEVGGVISTQYLYTVELINRFLDNIARDGTLAIRNHRRDWPSLFSTIKAALNNRDRSEHWQVHLASEIVKKRGYNLILLHRGPFSPAQEKNIKKFVHSEGFQWTRIDLNRADDNGLILTENHPYAVNLHNIMMVDDGATGKNIFFASRDSFPMIYRLAIPVGLAIVAILSLITCQGYVSQKRSRLLVALGGEYLACLGSGFMAMEMVFIEKMFFITGKPTLSLAITASSLLGGAMLASWLLRNRNSMNIAALLPGLSLCAALALGLAFYLLGKLAATPDASGWMGASIAAAVIFIPGALSGGLFPSGLRLLAEAEQESIPWSWAINGVASIIGGIAAQFLAITLGYRMVLLFTMICYGLAGIAAWQLASRINATNQR